MTLKENVITMKKVRAISSKPGYLKLLEDIYMPIGKTFFITLESPSILPTTKSPLPTRKLGRLKKPIKRLDLYGITV